MRQAFITADQELLDGKPIAEVLLNLYENTQREEVEIIKPVFDKMLVALKGIPYEALMLFNEERSRAIVEAIKEAEELKL